MAKRLHLIAPVAAALLAAAPAHADVPIASLAAATPVRAWAGTAVLSIEEPATGRYRLATERRGAAPRVVPGIDDASAPFDADIGPGPGGAATIVFARCEAPHRCRLARTTPAGGEEIDITGSAGADGFESAPTVWGNRIAFARHYATGSDRIYVRPLDAGKDVRSVRVPGVPARECDEVTRCRAVTDGRVIELDLQRATLAESIHFDLKTVGICGEGQMRLVDVRRRTSRLVQSTICGLSGSTLVGPSLTADHLLWARTCPGDEGGCENHSTLLYRYRLADGRLEQAPEPDVLTGFAALGNTGAIVVRAPPTSDGTCINSLSGTHPRCELAFTGPIAFAPRARRR